MGGDGAGPIMLPSQGLQSAPVVHNHCFSWDSGHVALLGKGGLAPGLSELSQAAGNDWTCERRPFPNVRPSRLLGLPAPRTPVWV